MITRSCSRCGADFDGTVLQHICPGCRAKTKAVRNHLRGAAALLAGKPLTERDMTVVRLICDGLMNKEIAHRLHLSDGTVKIYISRILDKTSKATRTELAVWATCKYFCRCATNGDGPHDPVKCDPPRDGAYAELA